MTQNQKMSQAVPERQEVLRRERFHHLPLVCEQAENLADTLQVMDNLGDEASSMRSWFISWRLL